jgi:hypothetical protein
MTNSATGDRIKQIGFINQHVIINKTQHTITSRSALFGAMIPRGISRIAVLGFRASNCLSSHLLKAMAALLAVIMQTKTRKKRISTTGASSDPAL